MSLAVLETQLLALISQSALKRHQYETHAVCLYLHTHTHTHTHTHVHVRPDIEVAHGSPERESTLGCTMSDPEAATGSCTVMVPFQHLHVQLQTRPSFCLFQYKQSHSEDALDSSSVKEWAQEELRRHMAGNRANSRLDEMPARAI